MTFVDLKENHQCIQAQHLVNLPASAEYGDLFLKEIKIIDRLQRINMLLSKLEASWRQLIHQHTKCDRNVLLNQQELIKDNYYFLEEIIYHLKV